MRFLTAGESHGKGYTGILEGVPRGLSLSEQKIAAELKRRQRFYGRSARMQLEDDGAEFLAGLRGGFTTGAPIAFFVKNKDFRAELVQKPEGVDPITKPRPSHADFAGMIKYSTKDARDIAERASGRETVARVCIGAICKEILSSLEISVFSHTLTIGDIKSPISYFSDRREALSGNLNALADEDSVRCLDKATAKQMTSLIDEAQSLGDTLGGEVELIVRGLPAGFGSHTIYDKRLDYKISGMLMSIPSVKSVSIGCREAFCQSGSQSSDPITTADGKILRPTNTGGGVEGGISNGSDIVVRLTIKPPPTMKNGVVTIDATTKEMTSAHYERSDICIVPTVSVVAESVLAFVVADTILCELGGDTMAQLKQRYLSKNKTLTN